MGKLGYEIISGLFEYETEKIVQITSIKIGIINRTVQLFIIGYFIGYVMIYQKGYQDTDTVVSAVIVKLKGTGFVNLSGTHEVWDVADYVVPPLENNAFFVTTNAVVTPKQQRGTCPEVSCHELIACSERKNPDPDVKTARCKVDSNCTGADQRTMGSGVFTGKCIKSTGTCEISGWCPVENDTMPIPNQPLFPMVENYTVMIKNFVHFPKFNVKRRNILPWTTKKFLRMCQYHWDHPEHKFCPIIRLGTIFEGVQNKNDLLVSGGAVAINIKWDCNLDWDLQYCFPEYTFSRLDEEHAKIAKGLNFRYAHYYYVNGTRHRDLIKAVGVRFIIYVTGQAGRFSVVPFTMNLGSGLALLGLASLFCDLLVLHCMGQKDTYRGAKFETVGGERTSPKRKKTNKNAVGPSISRAATPDVFSGKEEEERIMSQKQASV